MMFSQIFRLSPLMFQTPKSFWLKKRDLNAMKRFSLIITGMHMVWKIDACPTDLSKVGFKPEGEFVLAVRGPGSCSLVLSL